MTLKILKRGVTVQSLTRNSAALLFSEVAGKEWHSSRGEGEAEVGCVLLECFTVKMCTVLWREPEEPLCNVTVVSPTEAALQATRQKNVQ